MSGDSNHTHRKATLAARIREATGVSLPDCYQCGKCSAGCPVAEEMDYPPSLVLRMAQCERPELDAQVLGSEGIWLCLACETCVTRCPKEVDLPKVMDYLREEALAKGLAHPGSRDILAFHRAFLDSIRYMGRMSEVVLFAGYKLRSRHFFKDLALVPSMLFKGKIKLFPRMIKGRSAIRALFAKTIGIQYPRDGWGKS